MNFSYHKDLGNHLLQLGIQIIKHSACTVYVKFLLKTYYTFP